MLYNTSRAAKTAGVSPGTIRNLTSGQFSALYAGLWSSGAAPGKGAPRLFTEDDVKLLAFIRFRTKAGAPHVTIAEEVKSGVLASWSWSPGEEPPEASGPAQPETEGHPLPMLAPSLAAVQAIASELTALVSSQLEQAKAENRELQEALRAAEARAVRAETQAENLAAQLAELKAAASAARPSFWRRLRGD